MQKYRKTTLLQFDMQCIYPKSLVSCLSLWARHRSLQRDQRLTAARHRNKTTVSPGAFWQLKPVTVGVCHMELLDEALLATGGTPTATLPGSKTPLYACERRSEKEWESEGKREIGGKKDKSKVLMCVSVCVCVREHLFIKIRWRKARGHLS